MKPKTELLLYRLTWIAGKFGTPTYSNLTRDFDLWAYHSRLYYRVEELRAKGLIEVHQSEFQKDRFVRLTEAGRLIALGGRDPEEYWNQEWNRKWHLFLFDLPTEEFALRKKFHRALKAAGCGCMQGSVWISPRIEPGLSDLVLEKGEDCSHLITLEADSKGRKVDQRMVASAWNFSDIHQAYREHEAVLRSFPGGTKDLKELHEWIGREHESWQEAIKQDPLLPRELQPPGYLGIKVWEHRKTVVERAAGLVSRLLDSKA